jgi:small subunit ribosomal protein S4e
MRRHLKREAAPKNWPIARKGTTFVVKNNSTGIPVLVALRDLLKIAKTRREVKSAIHKNDLSISEKPVRDEKKSLELFDTLKVAPSGKIYRLILSQKGKYTLEEVQEKESKTKVAKIIGKKSLKEKKTQVNLSDGRNYISDLTCSVGDSAVVDFTKNRISRILPMKENSNILIVGGKHAGAKGTITKIIGEYNIAEVESADKKFRALIKQIMVIE